MTTTMPERKMFKVLCPMESRTGHKWWMRMGSAFTNKDNSINLYLDAIPTKAGATLQLRELTEEDMRISNERRAAFSVARNGNAVPNGTVGQNGGIGDHVGVGGHVAVRHGDVGLGGHAGSMPSALDHEFSHPADNFAANSAPF
jgi:hypothetical protein